MQRCHVQLCLAALAATVLSVSAGTAVLAEETESTNIAWRLPGLDTGLTGGLHTIYADRSGDGMADVYGGLTLLSQDDLFAVSSGARRIGYRVGGVFAILDMLEVGIDISGSSISEKGGSESMSSFGDIRLRGKYYHRMQALGLAGIVGYNLVQGVDGQSTLADVSSPLIGVGVSYFGRDCKASNPTRLHFNTVYVYDRTVNFLNGTRAPNELERFAWQMRDYTHLDTSLGFEVELEHLLPIVEYAIELPINAPGSFDPIHTISPGIKFNPIDAFTVTVGADLKTGGSSASAPATPLYEIALGFGYRFNGDIIKPIVSSEPSAVDHQPEPEEPAAAPTADTGETAPAIEEEAATDDPATPTAEVPEKPEVPVAASPDQTAPVQDSPAVDEKEPAAPEEKPAPKSAPVDLNQYAE